MSQAEVFKLLKRNNGWISTKDIEKRLKFQSAGANLSKLYKNKEVLRKVVKNGNRKSFIWRIK